MHTVFVQLHATFTIKNNFTLSSFSIIALSRCVYFLSLELHFDKDAYLHISKFVYGIAVFFFNMCVQVFYCLLSLWM